MAHRSLVARICGGLYLALAVTLSGVLPAADARGVESAPAAHVESPRESSCPPVHDHWDCTVCRALRLMARGEAAAAPDFAMPARVAARVEPARGFALPSAASALRSRAPPLS